MNEEAYLFRIIDIRSKKIVIHEFWYDYVKPKYGEKAKLCYMDTESFIAQVKTDDIYKDSAECLWEKTNKWLN